MLVFIFNLNFKNLILFHLLFGKYSSSENYNKAYARYFSVLFHHSERQHKIHRHRLHCATHRTALRPSTIVLSRLLQEAMRTSRDKPKKKEKNVKNDPLQGKIGNVYIPDQKIGEMALPNKSKGVKRERQAKQKHGSDDHASKKKKEDS